jgi:hypothetical protein
MKLFRRIGFVVVAVAIAVILYSGFDRATIAQSPSPTAPVGVPVNPIPVDPSLPANRPAIPTASPTTSPAATPSPPAGVPTVPGLPQTPGINPTTPLPAAPSAEPLPTQGEYVDPNGRFKVALLKGYKASPLAGSVLIESQGGNVAYTVLSLPQSQLGVAAGVLPTDALVQVARNAFKQGEGFETGESRSIAGGIQIDWTGNLTIAGGTQPVGGVILARQAQGSILLLLIAATEAGGDQVLGAASALANSLQPLQ